MIFGDKKHSVFCKASPVLEVLLHHVTECWLVEGVEAFQVHAHPFIVCTEAACSCDGTGCADSTARLRLTTAAAGLGGIGDAPLSYHGEANVIAIEGRNLHAVKLFQFIFIHALLQDGPANNKAKLWRSFALAMVRALDFQALHSLEQALCFGLGVLLIGFRVEAEAIQLPGWGQAAEWIVICYEIARWTNAHDRVCPGGRCLTLQGWLVAAGAADTQNRSHLLAFAKIC